MKSDSIKLLLSFDEVYNLYNKQVLNYLISLVGKSYADDIAQEAFIKIHKNLHTLKDKSKLSSWIFKIALNSARDRIRKELKSKVIITKKVDYHPETSLDDKTNLKIIHDQADNFIEEKIYRNEMINCYISYVNKLPENYYEIYVLSSFEGLSNKEIAKKLSITLETVKIRLHRAKSTLYKELRTNCQCYQNEKGELFAEPKH